MSSPVASSGSNAGLPMRSGANSVLVLLVSAYRAFTLGRASSAPKSGAL